MKASQVQKRILNELRENPAWSVVVPPNHWLCPYCGEIGVENLQEGDAVEVRIYQHFAEECTSWHFFQGEELPIEKLQERAVLLQLRQFIPDQWRENPAWHVRTTSGKWFCPFCLSPTELEWEMVQAEPLLSFRHLERCDNYLEREGEPFSQEEVLKALRRFQKQKKFQAIQKRILSTPEWQVLDSNGHWVCPYCLKETGVHLNRTQLSEKQLWQVLEHLQQCEPAKGGMARPQPLEKIRRAVQQINQRNRYRDLYESITSDTVYQLLTQTGEWFCPFCLESTGVVVKDYKWTEALPQISKHLGSCQAYKFARKPRPFEEVRAKLQEHNQKEKIVQFLESQKSNPVFRCTLKESGWVCPYCLTAQGEILIPAGDISMAFSDIAAHLLNCPSYTPGVSPRVTLEELRQAFRAKKIPTKEAKRKTTTGQKLSKWKEEQKELLKSLEDARERQKKMLPTIPAHSQVEFQCLFKPCHHIGGDFYNIVPLRENCFAVSIGDVTGHGVEAAILVGMVKKLIEVYCKESESPFEILAKTQKELVSDLDGKTFISVFLGILDLDRYTFTVANAGHLPPILYNLRREVPLQRIYLSGMVLGLNNWHFLDSLQEEEIPLQEGDVVFLYTDGLLEARAGEEEFGEERLAQVIERYGRYELEYLLYKVEKALRDFQGPKQQDDITICSFQLKERKKKSARR